VVVVVAMRRLTSPATGNQQPATDDAYVDRVRELVEKP
jgi:hypothetical protein